MINNKLSSLPLKKQKQVSFKSNYTQVLESKLSMIKFLSMEYLDENLANQGLTIIHDLIPFINPEKAQKHIENLQDFSPKSFEEAITHSGFYKNVPCSHPYLDEIKDLYKKLFGLDFFKLNLLKTIENIEYLGIPQEISKSAKTKLNSFGLKPEIKEAIQNSKEKLGIKIQFPNIRAFTKRIYEKIELHEKIYGKIPSEIKMNEIDFYIENPVRQTSLATYIPNISSEKITPSQIIFNASKSFVYLISGHLSELCDAIKHELGHHEHCENLGFKKWNELSFFDLFENKEKQIIKKLFEGFKDEKFEYMNDFQKTEMACNWANFSSIDENSIKVLQKVSTKLNTIKTLIEDTYGDYALTNPRELIAEAFRYSNHIDPPDELKKILKFFEMPKLKDRSKLPKDHPVMKNQK